MMLLRVGLGLGGATSPCVVDVLILYHLCHWLSLSLAFSLSLSTDAGKRKGPFYPPPSIILFFLLLSSPTLSALLSPVSTCSINLCL